MNKILSAALGVVAATTMVTAQNVMELNVAKKGAPIQSTMYGLFFEDINYAADGGLYAEMIKNRSFEFPQAFMGWEVFGKVELRTDEAPFERNPHYVRLSPAGHQHKHTGLQNEGFFGISTKKGEQYRFSVWARVPDGGKSAITVEFVNTASLGENQCYSRAKVEFEGKEWKKYTVVMDGKEDLMKGKFRIFLTSGNQVDLEHISLFPVNTFKGRENGLRADLAQALCDIKPGVFRFPGGCIVEGTDLNSRYQWKNSVGPVENRPLNENRWHYTFSHRLYPDYFQSYGLGFYEFFLLSEDMGAEPLPVLSVGLSCQFQNKEAHAHVPVNELQEYIQDALDLIEFANGATTTKWGKLRADMGHPEPFNMKFIGIGNEQWGPEYPERLAPFIEAIRKAYPDIKIIGSSGPDSEGKQFDYLWPEMVRLKADLVDEHFYRPESWFLAQGNRYDNYDRKGPKVFAGEYACHGKGKKWNHFNAALLEAAFMTNLERNADIVHMATYAPLFAHVEGWQWRPDMIWFDNHSSVKTCSYYVQQLYSHNMGTNTATLTMNKKPVAGNADQNGLFASAVYDANDGSYIIKVANVGKEAQDVVVNFKGLKKGKKLSKCTLTSLHSDNPEADNTVNDTDVVLPKTENIAVSGQALNVKVPAATFCVYRVNVE